MAKSTASAAGDTTPAAASAPAEVKYRVIINNDDNPGGKSDVVLTVNGRNVQIKRGQEVLVSESLLEVLRNAEIRGYEAMQEGRTVVVSGMPRFSYVVLGKVEAASESEESSEPQDGDPEGGNATS